MNIALSAFVIVLLVAPGAVFIHSYKTGFRALPSAAAKIQDNIVLYLTFAVPIHAICVSLTRWLQNFDERIPPISYRILIQLVTISELPNGTVSSLEDFLWYILAYLGLAVLVSAVAGWIAQSIVTTLFLDLAFPLIRPHAHWHYFFSGELAAMTLPRVGKWWQRYKKIYWTLQTLKKTDFVYISFVLPHSDTSYLYWGALYDYKVSGERLHQITLRKAYRRKLKDDDPKAFDEQLGRILPNKSKRYYPIRGNYTTFDAHLISSLNIEFYQSLGQELDSANKEEDLNEENYSYMITYTYAAYSHQSRSNETTLH